MANATRPPHAPIERRPPIFIVGCQRSGTTLLRLILDSHPHISCGPETRFLRSFKAITRDEWDRMSLYGFPKQYWHDRVASFFDSFQSEYAHSRGKSRWADKTPLYAVELDYIFELFPDAQVIHVIRDGRDVVASHRDTFGYWSAVKATVKWKRYIDFARSVGKSCGEGQYCEVRYEDLVRNTEAVLRRLLAFLGEPWDPCVLDYDNAPHDVLERYQRHTARRREAAKADSAIYNHRVGKGRREIDPLLRTLVRVNSRRTLRELGYR
jgi:hypothetical protein